MAIVNLKGQPCHTIGELPAMGLKAPDFKLTANDFSEKSLRDFRGKKKVINITKTKTPMQRPNKGKNRRSR